MLKYLENFFKDRLKTDEKDINELSEQKIMVATAAIFLEMAYADFEIDPQEEQEISTSLKNIFNIEQDEIDRLFQEAKTKRADNIDIWNFVHLLKDNFSREMRIIILENLWRLVFADGRVDKYEDALIRKLTTLLGLEHSDMIQAKLKISKL